MSNEPSVLEEKGMWEHLDDYISDDPPSLPPRDRRMERQLHHGGDGRRHWGKANRQGIDLWSANHEAEVNGIKALPYLPSIIGSQRMDRPVTRLSSLLPSVMPEKNYHKIQEYLYAKVVGSVAVADSIKSTYDTTLAFKDIDNLFLTDYFLFCIKYGLAFGFNSDHADGLSDIADFTGGAKMSTASRLGIKNTDNFKLLVNKNMTRESYHHLAIPLLGKLGIDLYWGAPPEGAAAVGINDKVILEINKAFFRQLTLDKKAGAVGLGFVRGGSRAKRIYNPETDALEKYVLAGCNTEALMTRIEGGLVQANRIGDKFEIGQVTPTTRGSGIKEAFAMDAEIEEGDKEAERKIQDIINMSTVKPMLKDKLRLADEVTQNSAAQIVRLSGVEVEYALMSGPDGQRAVLRPAA